MNRERAKRHRFDDAMNNHFGRCAFNKPKVKGDRAAELKAIEEFLERRKKEEQDGNPR